MDLNDLLRMIRSGESEHVEFKRNVSGNIHEDIVAFANADGGHILIGVDDDGTIVGANVKKSMDQVTSSIQSVIPAPEITTHRFRVDKKDVVVIGVGKSETLCSIGGVAHIRIGVGKRSLSIQEILMLSSELGTVEWDSAPMASKKKSQERYLDWYFEKMKESRGKNIAKRNRDRYLRSVGAIRGDMLTNAGLLFFTDATDSIQHSRIRLVYMDGDEPSGSVEYEGPIWKMIEDVYDAILKEITKTEVVASARRRRIQQYPPRAIREAAINALAHRNYTIPADIRVFIRRDRITIKSPGGLMPGVDLDDPDHIPRNPSLCNLLYDTGYIERYGYGIRMMKEEVKKHHGVRLEFAVKPHIFQVTLRRDMDIILDETDRNILQTLVEPMRSSDISGHIGATKPTVINHLRKLEQLGLVQKIGKGPQTRYRLR